MSHVKIGLPFKMPSLNLSRIGSDPRMDMLRYAAGPRTQWGQYRSVYDRNRYSTGPMKDFISIPNPIAILGNKLLSGIGKWLEGAGNKVSDFGARMQGQPRSLYGVPGPVTLPQWGDPGRMGSIERYSNPPRYGGGQFFNQGVRSSGSGEEALAQAGDALFAEEDKMFQEMAALSNSKDPAAQGKLLALQAKLQKLQRMISMITNMMMAGHETKKGAIQNLRV